MSKIESVKKRVLVNVPQERAFTVFTTNMDAWYPREHHIGKSPLKKAVLETKPNGRWYEIGEDGSECEWGKVLAWEPPHRVLLAWQIDGTWSYDKNFLTEVEVKFIADGEKKTWVELEHRNLERFGDHAEGIRTAIDSKGGWGGTLERFAANAEGRSIDEKKFFLCKLIPPRKTFTSDMTPDEMQVMKDHAAYWMGHLAEKRVIVFGPVLDPNGGYGIGVVKMDSLADVEAMRDADPAIKSGRGFAYEILPMPRAVYLS